MKVYVETNNPHGRYRLSPADIAKAESVGFSVMPPHEYENFEPLYRDEADLYNRLAKFAPVEAMIDPRFQGRLVIDINVDDEQKARATAFWKLANQVGKPDYCDCCGVAWHTTTDDVWSD